MRLAAILVALAGFLVGALMWLWPADISVLGTSVYCGSPIFTVISQPTITDDGTGLTAAIQQDCDRRSRTRVLVGIVVYVPCGCGTGALLITDSVQRGQRQRYWWDGYRWHPIR